MQTLLLGLKLIIIKYLKFYICRHREFLGVAGLVKEAKIVDDCIFFFDDVQKSVF
uniref:Uncharacterized protein n=1 Tax=Physcomitrium patens TaxID=3218 RepID=A0A2K1IS21_PHYPA|nr:hypothetical protein PHYPA_026206 [Physcomitrium patens]